MDNRSWVLLINAGKLIVDLQGLGEKFTQETDLTVRPASTLQKIIGSNSLVDGSTSQLTAVSSDFLPVSVHP